jgi:hypothetical protein
MRWDPGVSGVSGEVQLHAMGNNDERFAGLLKDCDFTPSQVRRGDE